MHCTIFKRPFVEVPKFFHVNDRIPEFKAQFTPYPIPFAPRTKIKPDRASVLTQKNGCGGANSEKKRSLATPISKVERHISDKYCAIVCAVCTPIRPVAEVNK